MNGPGREQWCVAYARELSNHEGMQWAPGTRRESGPPVGRRAIPTKVVLLKKRNDRGEVLTFKARLVARGDLQKPGDYRTTYAPTACIASVRIFERSNAFHRLRRSIYGLKQAGHDWNQTLHDQLRKSHG
ncbi:BQ5605_C017g08557 [Microbotryum silenes-dioicae]|uniref:BQ5605_C017g08557 protein n=1 Tax=Microbotryum silenes-dioicae TaxID=796604 RepID=A0A2X0LV12_9BASI|nr:BQ5605_C017g08557 [Microbotryum silenes-dioicae]